MHVCTCTFATMLFILVSGKIQMVAESVIHVFSLVIEPAENDLALYSLTPEYVGVTIAFRGYEDLCRIAVWC